MHITVKGEYALKALFDLASRARGEPVKIGDIARRQAIPQKFLELILAGLKQGGFVQSRRGAEGGYLLARRPEHIMVGEVLSFVEGAGGSGRRRRAFSDSPFADLWKRVDEAVSGLVDQTSMADLHRAWLEKQTKQVPNWEI